MNGEKTDQEIIKTTGDNKPEKLPDGGLSGQQQNVSPEMARKRRIVLSRLMSSTISDDEIYEMMNNTFGLKRHAVRSMMNDVFSQWSEESKTRAPYKKHAQVRRLHSEIQKAVKDASWSAVANLEKVLAMVEGNFEPLEINTPASDRLGEAVLTVLGEMDPRRVRSLIDKGRVLYTNGKVEILDKEPAQLPGE